MSQRLQAETGMTHRLVLRLVSIRSEQPGSRLKASSAQPSMAPSKFASLCPHAFIPCPPFDLADLHDRSDRSMPLKIFDSILSPEISTFLGLLTFRVEATGTVNFISNRFADAVDALNECSAKRLLRSVLPRDTWIPIQASLGNVYFFPCNRGLATSAMANN